MITLLSNEKMKKLIEESNKKQHGVFFEYIDGIFKRLEEQDKKIEKLQQEIEIYKRVFEITHNTKGE